MKYLKTFENILTTEEKVNLLDNTCYYLEDIMSKIEGFEDCVWSATNWIDDNINNKDIELTFSFNTNNTEDDEFEIFDEFLRNNRLDNETKERYYDSNHNSIFTKRMVDISIKISVEKTIELGKLYNDTNKFNL